MPSNTAPNAENLLLGKGRLMFDRFDANGVSSGGYRDLGNVETFEITTEDDVVEKYSSMSRSAGLLKRVTRRRTVTLRATGNEFNAENLALALMGTVGEATQLATAVVDEVLSTNAVDGGFYKFAKLGPYTVVSLEIAGATPLVLGTDWRWIDQTLGIVQLIPGSATVLADLGEDVTASYTPTAYTAGAGAKTVAGGTESLIEGKVLFIGDPSAGPAMMVEVWRVSASPDGAIGLISEDFAAFGLQMAVQEDATVHPTEPLYRVTYTP